MRQRLSTKIALVCAALSIASSSAFAEHPTDNPSAAQEWRSLVEPMLPIGERLLPLMQDSEEPQLRQEMYRLVFSGFSAAYLALLHADPEYPDFWPIFNMAFPQFAANPDDTYYATPINPNGVYKISGYRGTVKLVDFQIANGLLVSRGSGSLGPVYANYDLDKLHIKKDGSFEVILSAERPTGYKGDWWQIDPKAKAEPLANYILVRQVSYDWLHEVDGRFAIERLDNPAIRPRQSAQEIEANLRQLGVFAEGWTRLSLQWPKKLAVKGLINQVMVLDLSSNGGLSTQKYIEGLFDLAPDEALIYETEIPEQCRYWNIELTDMSWVALDYMNRQTHINGHMARLDKDGKFRAVVAATDPGVPNWLDNAGYGKGMFFGRWTECSSSPTPTITKVKLADVRKYLPSDTPVVTAEARDVSLRLRRKAMQLRRRW